MSALLLDHFARHARDRPLHAALVIDGTGFTWSALHASSMEMSEAITRSLAPDALIAVIGASGPGAWIAVTAALRARRRVMLLPANLPDRVLAPIVASFRPDLVRSSVAHASDAEVTRVHAMLATLTHAPRGSDESHASQLLLFSSGTTGRPRAIVRSAAALDRVAETLHAVIDFGPQERVLSFLPMHHAYGLEHALLAPLFGGATVEQRSPNGPHAATLILEQGITILPATPILLDALADAPPAIARAAHTLRRVYSAGSALPPTIASRMHAAWAVRADDLYGASELGTITLSNGANNDTVPGVTLRVVDPEIADALVDRPPGVSGEIVVHSDAMFDGYTDDRDSRPRRERTIDGFFRTGDVGVLTPDGPRVSGRLKLQYDIGGLKVNAEEVERVLASAPGVAHAVVLPLPVSETLQRLRAVIEPKPGAVIDRDALAAYARANLAAHEVPRAFDFVTALPRTPSGKILRGALMQRADAAP